jgi:signal transduction histidine kinase
VRRNELQRTVDALDASIQIARALGGLTDITGILEMVAKRGRALVAARALISELTDGDQLIMSAAAGEVPPSVVGRRIDLQDTDASTALRTARTQRLEDEPNRARFQRHGAGRLGFDVTAGLVVPLVFRGHPYGVLVAVDRVDHGPVFTAADQRLLEAFATSAATAVATANSAATERRSQHIAATEQERTRWARELHDETLQGLAALRLGLDSAQRTGDPEVIARVVGQTVSQLGVEIEGLRSLITDLRPMLLDQLGPAAAIEALADRARQEGLEIDVSIELESEWHQGPGGITPEVETAMYRVVQEGLTNARKHGQARRVVVEISELRGVLHITVRDDGTGFDVAAETEGFGLVGMRERAELLEGALGVQSAPGKGTTITVTFPSRRPTVGARPGRRVMKWSDQR